MAKTVCIILGVGLGLFALVARANNWGVSLKVWASITAVAAVIGFTLAILPSEPHEP